MNNALNSIVQNSYQFFQAFCKPMKYDWIKILNNFKNGVSSNLHNQIFQTKPFSLKVNLENYYFLVNYDNCIVIGSTRTSNEAFY